MAQQSAAAYYAAARAHQTTHDAVYASNPANPAVISSGGSSVASYSPVSPGFKDSNNNNNGTCTTTALSRWSLLDDALPDPASITSIHVYDFDNTLFDTPVPNKGLWTAAAASKMQSAEFFQGGGWWHEPRILAATGAGREAEEARAWSGWWNEDVAALARLSAREPGVLTVLLTGRDERRFGDLVLRMVRSKGLVFDLVGLKPAAGPNSEQFASTMAFKQTFLEAVMETYGHATELRIYEDRPRHVEVFRAFLAAYSERRQTRREPPPLPPLRGNVVAVAPKETHLDPVVETAEVLRMVDVHNAQVAATGTGRRLRLDKAVLFTAYLIKEADTQRLLRLIDSATEGLRTRRDFREFANSIMIGPRHCSPETIAAAGGLGHAMRWRVEALGNVDNQLWAAKVVPAVPGTTYATLEATPLVVLAVCRGARPHDAARVRRWHAVAPADAIEFDSVVAEKATLRLEYEGDAHDERGGVYAERGGVYPNKRRRGNGGRGGPVSVSGVSGPGPGFGHGAPHSAPHGASTGVRGGYSGHSGRGHPGRGRGQGYAGRGDRGAFRGGAGRGGRGGAGRGRGMGYFQYTSLDNGGPSQAPQQAQSLPRNQIVYDE